MLKIYNCFSFAESIIFDC